MTADAKFWDDIAEEYARKPIAKPEAYQRKLAITKARMSPEDTVLDVGCGTGSLALELAPDVSHVHAIDVSEGMLQIANRKAEDQSVSNVTFHQATLDALPPFPAASFHGVCAYNILHLVADRAAALQALFDLLAPGGWFVSSTVCLGDSYAPYRLILPVMSWIGKAPPVWIVRRGDLLREMADAGFVDLSTPEVGANSTTAFVVGTKPG